MENLRRKFIKQSALSTFSLALGMQIVHGATLPSGILPIALDGSNNLPGKSSDLQILNDRPINAETPAHLLDDLITPNNLFFVRNNGVPPIDPIASSWKLTIAGESAKSKKVYSIKDLKSRFKTYSYDLTLECGGNGRSEFNPPAKGNQWTTGAVGCAKWTGVRLKDILKDVGIKPDAVYIGYYGKDTHLSGDPSKNPISRGVPISKAMQEESLIAWEMNGDELPLLNGYPLRLVFGGWPASCSGKWLSKIVVRNKVHDGAKMTGQSYRIPTNPVAPGTKVPDKDMKIIERMPVKSIITYPKTGAIIQQGNSMDFRGHAWAGDLRVNKVEFSTDFGATWQDCNLTNATNLNAWQHFKGSIQLSQAGYYELWVKATDENGISQPMILPGWNPRGYLNNACHRIALKVQS